MIYWPRAMALNHCWSLAHSVGASVLYLAPFSLHNSQPQCTLLHIPPQTSGEIQVPSLRASSAFAEESKSFARSRTPASWASTLSGALSCAKERARGYPGRTSLQATFKQPPRPLQQLWARARQGEKAGLAASGRHPISSETAAGDFQTRLRVRMTHGSSPGQLGLLSEGCRHRPSSAARSPAPVPISSHSVTVRQGVKDAAGKFLA